MDTKDAYFEQFKKSIYDNKAAQNYLKSRGFSNKLIDNDQIGFCPPYSRYSFTFLRGRLIIPIRNHNGELIAMAGRQVDSFKEMVYDSFWDTYGSDPSNYQIKIDKWNKGKWINEPYIKSRNLYFLDKAKKTIREKNYVFICEGYFDVLSLYENGIENVVALCGTSISEYQIALMSRFCDNLILLMDSDNAGRTASEKISSKINSLGLNAKRIYLPEGLDPDDFAKKYNISFLDKKVIDMIDNKKEELKVCI